jgi:hypothetical protein
LLSAQTRDRFVLGSTPRQDASSEASNLFDEAIATLSPGDAVKEHSGSEGMEGEVFAEIESGRS